MHPVCLSDGLFVSLDMYTLCVSPHTCTCISSPVSFSWHSMAMWYIDTWAPLDPSPRSGACSMTARPVVPVSFSEREVFIVNSEIDDCV